MAQAPIFVYGSTFDGNSAKIAGAIYASAPIQIYNSVFTGNESTEEAGGALFSKNTLFITSQHSARQEKAIFQLQMAALSIFRQSAA